MKCMLYCRLGQERSKQSMRRLKMNSATNNRDLASSPTNVACVIAIARSCDTAKFCHALQVGQRRRKQPMRRR